MSDNNKWIRRDLKMALFVIFCILINYLGMKVATIFDLPLWLDSVGTAICAYVMGPVCGAIVGVSINIIRSFEADTEIYYVLTSVVIGIVVGISARKKMFETVFKTSTIATLLTFVATLISTPINCITNKGYIGNVWGDGMFEMLREWEFNWVASSVIAQIMIEFLDKLITLLIVFIIIKCRKNYVAHKKFMDKEKVAKAASIVIVCILSLQLVFAPGISASAAEAEDEKEDYNSYIQTVYSNNNGLLSGEANDIVTTNDGILWIATYAGLYRYNGTTFKYMNQLDTVKNANDLYVDVEGRLWIGTNDNGLSILINGEIVNSLDDEAGLPSNSIRSIVQQSGGHYFVGTSSDLAVVSLSGGIRVVGSIPEVQYAKSLTADSENHIAAVTSDGELFLIDDMDIDEKLSAPEEEGYFSSCLFDSEGKLYVGTENGNVYRYTVENHRLKFEKKYIFNQYSVVNSLYESKPGEIFVCEDNGIAVINNEAISNISIGGFNSSIEHMTVDYQGDLWFSSSRLGVMKLCKTAFAEVYQEYGLEEKVVNTITKWNRGLYFGTDNGLDIINLSANSPVKNELTKMLEDTRIRSLMVDSKNNLWICTYGKGAICVNTSGDVQVYDSEQGIEGNRFRHALELSNGSVALSNDKGVALVKDGKLLDQVSVDDGLTNSVVLCLYETADNTILAGTDGGGICVIKDGKVIRSIKKADGLGSEVILRLSDDKDSDGVFITTSNGICYLDPEKGVIKISHFPYSNNYEVYDMGDGRLLIPSSAGIYMVNKEQMLNGEELKYELLNYMNGLRGTLTANAWNYVNSNGEFYFANGSGVTKLDLNNYKASTSSYRMLLKNAVIDGNPHEIDKDSDFIIPREAQVIELTPEIVNYSANDPYVRCSLYGSTEEPIVVRQSELSTITYNNIKSGEYRFDLAILDDDNRVVEEQTYNFIKEKKIYDNTWFKVFFFAELVAFIAWITWFITRTTIGRTLELQKQEIEMTRKQLNMGNETILAIAKTVDAKDENTSQHSIRVSEYCLMIAQKLGYSEEDCENLRKAALLHDIGKIGIPDSVLNKPSRLTDEEYAIMKSHVVRGGEILKDFTLIPNVQIGAMYHHERYDGKGYVHGLKGEEIPEWARIIGIADAFDAMTANRVYRKQLDFDYVLEEIRKGRGTQFDPRMADIMLELIESGEIDVDALYTKKDLKEEI